MMRYIRRSYRQERNFPDDLTYPAFIKEKVLVMDTSKNRKVIVVVNLAFIGDSKPNKKYLMAENR